MKASCVIIGSVLLASIVFASVSGCNLLDTSPDAYDGPDQDSLLVGPSWILHELYDSSTLPDGDIALRFSTEAVGDSTHRVFVNLYCTTGSGPYSLEGVNGIRMGDIFYRQIACGGGKDAVIGAFLIAARRVDRYMIDGTHLALRDRSEETLIRFRKAPSP